MHEKHQKRLFWAIILSETSHIFCCVLPTLISLLSLLAGFGLVVAMPGWLQSMHDFMHRWEPVMVGVSVFVVALGWGLYFYSKKAECCHHTGCHHAPCGPRKKIANKILIVATILMIFNVGMYFGVHRPMEAEHIEYAHGHEH
jgi:hypothetical protein